MPDPPPQRNFAIRGSRRYLCYARVHLYDRQVSSQVQVSKLQHPAPRWSCCLKPAQLRDHTCVICKARVNSAAAAYCSCSFGRSCVSILSIAKPFKPEQSSQKTRIQVHAELMMRPSAETRIDRLVMDEMPRVVWHAGHVSNRVGPVQLNSTFAANGSCCSRPEPGVVKQTARGILS